VSPPPWSGLELSRAATTGGPLKWEWISELDELETSMRRGLVLWGFEEADKAFPPSYRFMPTPPNQARITTPPCMQVKPLVHS
jgi:hypothetical protein